MVVLLMATGYGVYILGGEHRASDYGALKKSLLQADEESSLLNGQLVELRGEVASLRQRQKINQQARRNYLAELGRLRHQLTETRKELELYSRLADRKPGISGAGVRQLKVSAAATLGEFHYELLLAQPLTATGKAAGRVRIELVDVDQTILVAEREFNFQVFEKFSGKIVAPEGLAINKSKILVTIMVKDQADVAGEFSLRELLGAERADERS